MSPIYNRYVAGNAGYSRVPASPASNGPAPPREPPQSGGLGASLLGSLLGGTKKPPGSGAGGLGDLLRGFLPPGIDAGDLLLLLVLLLLYLESQDEDFLIMLVVVGYSVLKGK